MVESWALEPKAPPRFVWYITKMTTNLCTSSIKCGIDVSILYIWISLVLLQPEGCRRRESLSLEHKCLLTFGLGLGTLPVCHVNQPRLVCELIMRRPSLFHCSSWPPANSKTGY